MKQNRHIHYLDYLRVFAALCVVWMHTAAPGLRAGVTRGWHLMNLVTSLAFTAVPLFFMISGFLLLSDEKTVRTDVLLKRRLPRLFWPLLCWTLVVALWHCYQFSAFHLSYIVEQLVSTLYNPILIPFWFMYTLLAIYLISPLLRGGVTAVGREGGRVVLCIAAVVSLRAMVLPFLPDEWQHWLNVDILNKLRAWGGYLLLFLLGWYLGNLERKIDNRLLIAVAVVCYAVIVVGTWRRTVDHGEYDALFQDQSAGFEVILAVCLFLLAKQNLDRPWKPLQRSGLVPLLLPVYFLHAVLLTMFNHIGINPMRTPAIAGATLLNFLLCWLIAKTLASFRWTCYPFTGMPYDRACQSCNWTWTARRWKKRRAGK